MANTMSPEAWQAYLAEDASWLPFRCSVAAIVVVTVAYAGRFWARSLQAAPWSWFDSFMVPSYIATIGTSVCGILAAEWGTGRHLELLYYGSDEDFDRWGLLTYYISAFLYMAGIVLPRLSILCLYGRLFRDKLSMAGIWLCVFMMVTRMIAEAVVLFLQCDHVSASWHEEDWSTHCSAQLLQHYTWSRIPNIAVDVIMLVLPLPTLWGLNLATAVKVGVIATFCLGAFGMVTAIIGFVAFLQGMNSLDQPWVNSPMIAWTVLEPAAYFTSACMLTYKPLIRLVAKTSTVQSVFTWTRHTKPEDSFNTLRPRERSIQVVKEWRIHHAEDSELSTPIETREKTRDPSHPDWVMPTSSQSAVPPGLRCGTCRECRKGAPCENREEALSYFLSV